MMAYAAGKQGGPWRLTARARAWLALTAAIATLFALSVPTFAAAAVLSRTPHDAPAGMSGSSWLIAHTMPGVTQSEVTVSTLLFLPDGKAPPGGWPVVAWVHGSTTPGYKPCAPSLSPDFDGGLTAGGFRSDYGFMISSLVNAGYAVVAPDFEGIGAAADSPNPGFNSGSIANAVLYGLRAAHAVDPDLSKAFVTVGHSDGARALVAFDQLARNEADLRHRGTVALAPFTSITAILEGLSVKRASASGEDVVSIVALQNFIVGLVATGLQVQQPDFDAHQIFGADLAAVFPRLRSLCAVAATTAVAEAVKRKGAETFDGIRADWAQVPAMKRFLEANDPAEMANLSVVHPMLIVVGTRDDFVPVAPLARLVNRQTARRGAPITLDVRDGGDHFSIIRDREAEILRFIAAAFADPAAPHR